MRILEALKKEKGSLTVDELIEKYEREMAEQKQAEADEFNKVRSDYNGAYLKRINMCTFFGETLEVFHIEEVTKPERTIDWTFIYKVNATRISFSKRDVNNYLDANKSFSLGELNQMEKISKEEFDGYVNKYNEITDKLSKIIKNE